MITYTITVCDELEILKSSLQSITGSLYSDEKLLIQYDTNSGSIDVKNFLDSTGINYLTHSFDGDYGKMKNKLLANVDTNWIFHLDGDEYVENNALDINREYIIKFGNITDGFLIKRININTDTDEIYGDDHIRLFKNRKWIRWDGKIHETITGCERLNYIENYQIQHFRTTEQISASINLK